ncbi:MAG: LytTR family DNA-binding domain-containing protein [Bacteroidota bacterium]
MLSCIAIDDEPLALHLVKEYIGKVSFLQLKGSFTDAVEAKAFLEKEKVDIIFLDIQMPDINGIQFYNLLIQKPMLIFTTAYSEYAVEGFNINAVDYLLKPFEYGRFQMAVYKAKEYHDSSLNQEEQVTSLFVKVDYHLVKVELQNILFIEGLDDYIRIHLAHGKSFITLMSLKAMTEKLPPNDFVRIHRSYIVPFKRVEKVGGKKIEIAGREIPIGIRYAKEFFTAMNKKTPGKNLKKLFKSNR